MKLFRDHPLPEDACTIHLDRPDCTALLFLSEQDMALRAFSESVVRGYQTLLTAEPVEWFALPEPVDTGEDVSED